MEKSAKETMAWTWNMSYLQKKSKNNNPIFLTCPLTTQVWKGLSSHFGFPYIQHASIEHCLQWWRLQKADWRSILPILFWEIWKWRNNHIFQNRSKNFYKVTENIIICYTLYSTKDICYKAPRHKRTEVQRIYPMGFFDGAAQQHMWMWVLACHLEGTDFQSFMAKEAGALTLKLRLWPYGDYYGSQFSWIFLSFTSMKLKSYNRSYYGISKNHNAFSTWMAGTDRIVMNGTQQFYYQTYRQGTEHDCR